MTPSRRRPWTPTLLVVVVALMINLPVMHGLYLTWRGPGPGAARAPIGGVPYTAVVVTLFADAALALMLYLLWRFRGRLRPQLQLVATQDLERCAPGSVLDRIEGDRYVVCGEVLEIGDDELVLDLGDRRVQVLLDGHANPVGHQQPARATGRMVG